MYDSCVFCRPNKIYPALPSRHVKACSGGLVGSASDFPSNGCSAVVISPKTRNFNWVPDEAWGNLTQNATG